MKISYYDIIGFAIAACIGAAIVMVMIHRTERDKSIDRWADCLDQATVAQDKANAAWKAARPYGELMTIRMMQKDTPAYHYLSLKYDSLCAVAKVLNDSAWKIIVHCDSVKHHGL